MMENKGSRLPFLRTVANSFKYVFKNKTLIKNILPVVAVLIVLQMLIGMPFLCSLRGTCQVGGVHSLTILSIVLGAAGIIINYCRTIVCKAEVDFYSFNFWKRMFFYLLASVVLSLVFFIVLSISFILSAKLLIWLNLGEYALWGVFVDMMVVFVLLSPLFLAFPAIAVEDYELLLPKKMFKVAKGNYNAIFWGQFSIMIPYWLIFGALKEIYAFVPENSYLINLLFVICLVLISMLDSCFKGAFFAHIYQFFKKKADEISQMI